MEIKNGKITEVTITMADHGVCTFYLIIEGNGVGFAYGGYVIGHGYLNSKHFNGSSKGIEAMLKIMDTVGVDTWENLKGQYIRYEDNGLGSSVKKIGNIITDKWFDIEEFFTTKE